MQCAAKEPLAWPSAWPQATALPLPKNSKTENIVKHHRKNPKNRQKPSFVPSFGLSFSHLVHICPLFSKRPNTKPSPFRHRCDQVAEPRLESNSELTTSLVSQSNDPRLPRCRCFSGKVTNRKAVLFEQFKGNPKKSTIGKTFFQRFELDFQFWGMVFVWSILVKSISWPGLYACSLVLFKNSRT